MERTKRQTRQDPVLLFHELSDEKIFSLGTELKKRGYEAAVVQDVDRFEQPLKSGCIYLACRSLSLSLQKKHEAAVDSLFTKGTLGWITRGGEEVTEKIMRGFSIIIAVEHSLKEAANHIETAMQYPVYIDPKLQVHVLKNYQSLKPERKIDSDGELHVNMTKARQVLSKPESEVLDLMLKGKSNRQIAESCFLATSTVNNHVSNLTKKMEANDRTHAVKRAVELGWLT
ncbi:regulatory LuxR family protein [Salsuginibacillus halophilus]|uniref:Regulatory LuxR family protein n=1 Tax=Salsuginibacillus halophilus TaxID=517424 RepID=A0A2P8HQS7_9BACI|nr:LuxR C-terminal-related transcriptional regulator [Salsuginibacillus halophilus]PSL48576.1 regulatory LuxR family protein [Salsuginibacillus halophilus]